MRGAWIAIAALAIIPLLVWAANIDDGVRTDLITDVNGGANINVGVTGGVVTVGADVSLNDQFTNSILVGGLYLSISNGIQSGSNVIFMTDTDLTNGIKRNWSQLVTNGIAGSGIALAFVDGALTISTNGFAVGGGGGGAFPTGVVEGAYTYFVSTNEVEIGPGYGDANGTFWQVTTNLRHTVTSMTANAQGVYYILIDSINGNGEPVLTDTATHPTNDPSRGGLYVGNARFIGGGTSFTNTTEIFEFTTLQSGRILLHTNGIEIAASDNPDSTWKAGNRNACGQFIPTNSSMALVYAQSQDTGRCSVGAIAAENANFAGGPNPNFGPFPPSPPPTALWTINNNEATPTYCGILGWLDLGPSGDVFPGAEDDDDNTLFCYMIGFEMNRNIGGLQP